MSQVTDYAGAGECVLEVLQHKGAWLSLAAVQVELPHGSAAVYAALQELVRLQQAMSQRTVHGTVWKAVMEAE